METLPYNSLIMETLPIVDEYTFSFVIQKLFLPDSKYDDITISLTFSNNVLNIPPKKEETLGKKGAVKKVPVKRGEVVAPVEDEPFLKGLEMIMHFTPKKLAETLKLNPIMFHLTRGENCLGTAILPLSESFANSFNCTEFTTQTLEKDLPLHIDNEETGRIQIIFKITKNEKASNFATLQAYSKLKDKVKKSNEKSEYNTISKEIEEALQEAKAIVDRKLQVTVSCAELLENFSDTDLPVPDWQKEIEMIVKKMIKEDSESKLNESCKCGSEAKIQDIPEFMQKIHKETHIVCKHCGGISISGVTCTGLRERKDIKLDRYCHRCCVNLNALPEDATCPNCFVDGVRPEIKTKNLIKSSEMKTKTNSIKTTNIKKVPTFKKVLKRSVYENKLIEIPRTRLTLKKISPTTKKLLEVPEKIKIIKKQDKWECRTWGSSSSFGSFISDPKTQAINKIMDKKTKNKTRSQFIKDIKKQAKGKYTYEFGTVYPGNKIGHQQCNPNDELVPKYMGWQWKIVTLGINKMRRGWCPGAVPNSIKELMRHFLSPYPCDTFPNSKPNARQNKSKCLVKQKPTIRVSKRDGEYTITVNPLKTKDQMKHSNDPYAEGPPIEFRISRNVELTKKHLAKRMLKERGFEWTCQCTNIKTCHCISEQKKCEIFKEMVKISLELGMKKALCTEDLVNCSDSELDVEFTPPSAMPRGVGGKIPDVSVAETQYHISDFLLQKSMLDEPKTNLKRVSGIPVKKILTDLTARKNILEPIRQLNSVKGIQSAKPTDPLGKKIPDKISGKKLDKNINGKNFPGTKEAKKNFEENLPASSLKKSSKQVALLPSTTKEAIRKIGTQNVNGKNFPEIKDGKKKVDENLVSLKKSGKQNVLPSSITKKGVVNKSVATEKIGMKVDKKKVEKGRKV